MDPNIILGGQGVNALGAIAAGNQAAAQQQAFQAANALAPIQQQQAELQLRQANALAPMELQGAQLELQAKQQQLAALKQQAMQQAAEQASRMTAQQIAAERDQQTRLLKGAAVFYGKQDRAGYDQFLKLNGVDPAQFPFDHFEAVAAMADGVLEVYDRFAPQRPQPQSSAGKLEADYRAGLIPPEVYQAEIAATGKPAVQVNMGEGSAFYDALDKGSAATFQKLMDQGIQAQKGRVVVDRLGALLQQTPTGMEGAAKYLLGQIGIPTEGLDNVQAVSSLIEQLVPQQREPGSGPMSDKDIEMFRASLPRLINQPGGNQIILSTMRAITDYTLQQSQIAAQVADRTMTPAEGRKALMSLQNPLAQVTNTGTTDPASFSQMAKEDLAKVDIMTLDPAALDAFEKRWKALSNGNN